MKTNGESVGAIAQRYMVTDVPIAHPEETVAHVEERLIKDIRRLETINYIYVTDADGVLVGVFSIKELFRQPKTSHVKDVMKAGVVTAYPKTKRERVARSAVKRSIKAVPIIDKQKKLLGVVPSDAIFEILEEENTSDFLRLAGVHAPAHDGMDLLQLPVRTVFLRRLPWLLIGLIGGTAAAFVVEHFGRSAAAHLLVMSFIPAVVYIADAVGSQTQTIFIRALALEEELDVRRYAWRESRIGLWLALSLGVLAGGIVLVRWRVGAIGAIIATSFFVTILIAMTIAILLPLIFRKLKWDPAIASGPFATVIRDITTLVIYFTIAERILSVTG